MTVDFNDYFWGDKNNGFDVLYHNMKYGLVASKELSEYFRERSTVEENSSKLMTKLANKAGSGCSHGTFAPIWIILKSSAERLSTLHLQMVQKICELVKDITKYADELHKKHKTVKEEEAGTLEAVQAMQTSTVAVQKAKDVYTAKMQELEKIRKDNGSTKDLEKAESKVKKSHDDYKALVEKHNPVKTEFERRMGVTCKRFQEIEEAHLKQMKEFLTTYIELIQTNHDSVGQVQSEFKRQFLEMTVDKLLEQFVLNKYTGLEKPEIIELDVMNWTNTSSPINQTNSSSNVPPLASISMGSNDSNNTPPMALANKKESTKRSWFTSVGSSSTPTAMGPVEPLPIQTTSNETSISSNRNQNLTNQNEILTSQELDNSSAKSQSPINISSSNSAGVPSMNINKTNNGESNSKNNKIDKNTAQQENIQQKEQQQQQQQQQKSSRRTTSLLNLFMSNSQGSRDSRNSRDSASVDAISAPTSPSGQIPINQAIGRNPLRGSKFSGFLRSRREKAKTKKAKKKKDSSDTNSNKDEKISDGDDKEDPTKSESNIVSAINSSPSTVAPTAQAEIDEDGYTIRREIQEVEQTIPKEAFYSSSDSDSEDERERKIHVEIKPLNNGTAPISASVDELRATVGNISLSPIGAISARRGSNSESDTNMKRSQSVSQQIGDKPSNDLLGLNLFNQHQSPIASNASTPTATHPYAPLQSPTLSVTTNSRYDVGDIFSEVGEISGSAPNSANLNKINRQTPTSGIAIPRPPSRRSAEAAARGRISPAQISRADSVGSLEFRTQSVGIGSSRGPSPLTIGMSDTIPVAVAFHESVHAYFRGSDETRCQVKMAGELMLSFPAGIVNVLANNPNPAKLGFRIKNIQNLENVYPNKQLVTIDKQQSTSLSTMLEFNMPALIQLLKRQTEQNPNDPYFNIAILKYQVKTKLGASSCPLQLVCYWKCESTHTDLKIDYKYNSHSMAQASPLLNVTISVPVDGGVKNVQSKPHSAWLGESNRLVWNFTDISQHSDNNGVDTLRARLEVGNGPTNPATLNAQFNCEGTTLSGIEFELVGAGYRLSLVKRRFVSGKYICDGDGIRGSATPTPPMVSSPNSFTKGG